MPVEEVPLSAFDDMETAALVAEDVGLGVEFGGEVWADHAEEAEVPAELIGLGFAVIVLLLSFRSVVAMGLTISTALIGTGIGLFGVSIASAFFALNHMVSVLAYMLGPAGWQHAKASC